jgi:uncharacterized protein (DUF2267 family)
MARLGVLLVAVGMLGGCAPELPEGVAYVDPGFDADTAEAVVAAVDEWRIATDRGAELYPEIADTGKGDVLRIRPWRGPDGASSRERGFLIQVNTEVLRTPSSVFTSTLHEIGHAIGLDHASYGIMQDTRSKLKACLDDRTVRDACDILGDCGPAAKGTCPASDR